MAWTDDPLQAGWSGDWYDKVHYTELHSALWTIYTDAGLTSDDFDTWKAVTFPEFYTDETTWKPYIRNDWVYEIRDAIDNGDLLDYYGYDSLEELLLVAIEQTEWTDPELIAGQTFIRNNHIEDLRNAIDNLTEIVKGHGETWETAEVKTYNPGDSIYGIAKDHWLVSVSSGEIILIDGNKKYNTVHSDSRIISRTSPSDWLLIHNKIETISPSSPDIFYDYIISEKTVLKLLLDAEICSNGSCVIWGGETYCPLQELILVIIWQDGGLSYYNILYNKGSGCVSNSGIKEINLIDEDVHHTAEVGDKVETMYLMVNAFAPGAVDESVNTSFNVTYDNIELTGDIETFNPAEVKEYLNLDEIHGVTVWKNGTDGRTFVVEEEDNKWWKTTWDVLDNTPPTAWRAGAGIQSIYDDPLEILFYNYEVTEHTKLRLTCEGGMTFTVEKRPPYTSTNVYCGMPIRITIQDLDGLISTFFVAGIPIEYRDLGTYTSSPSGVYDVDLSSLAGKTILRLKVGISLTNNPQSQAAVPSNWDIKVDDIRLYEDV